MSRAPLDGLRMLAVSQFGAGPFGTQVLADLGAEIIKIEDPGVGGDSSRYVAPYRRAATRSTSSPSTAARSRSRSTSSTRRARPCSTTSCRSPRRLQQPARRPSRQARPDLRGAPGRQSRGRVLLAHGLRRHGAARRRAGLRLPDPGLRGLHVGHRRARRPARQVRRVRHRLRGRLRRHGRPHGRALGRPAHRRRPRHRHLAPRHRGEHALVLRDLGPEPRVAARARADSGHQSLVPAQNFPTGDGWIVVFCNKPKFWQALVERWSCPSSARMRASPASRSGSPTRPRWSRSSRRGSPSARPPRGWRLLRGRVPCAPVNTRGPGAGRRAGARARDDHGGGASALRPHARGGVAGEDRGRDQASGARPSSGRAHRGDIDGDPGVRQPDHRPAPGGRRHREMSDETMKF